MERAREGQWGQKVNGVNEWVNGFCLFRKIPLVVSDDYLCDVFLLKRY
jgi:hypothetical protein